MPYKETALRSDDSINNAKSQGIYDVGYAGHFGILVVFVGYYIMQLYIDNNGVFKKRVYDTDSRVWRGDTI